MCASDDGEDDGHDEDNEDNGDADDGDEDDDDAEQGASEQTVEYAINRVGHHREPLQVFVFPHGDACILAVLCSDHRHPLAQSASDVVCQMLQCDVAHLQHLNASRPLTALQCTRGSFQTVDGP